MSRAVSTVLDTMVFLVLVSAAALVVTAPPVEPVNAPADDTAEVVATSTATVEYEFGRGETVRRHASGTYAGLLARAAVANATLGGEHLAPAGPAFAASVRKETSAVLGANVQVSARWAPYPGAPVAGQVTVGPDPPPRADVHVARFRVPVSVPATEPERTYGGVARGVADAVAQGVLPDDGSELPLDGGPRWEAVSRRVDVLGGQEAKIARRHASGGNATAARDVAAKALAGVLATDLGRQFDSPDEAAEAVSTGTATVVVRQWDA
ncbi:MAG: hypothetical protein V5A30_02390 [Haloarculaceae archaeon]